MMRKTIITDAEAMKLAGDYTKLFGLLEDLRDRSGIDPPIGEVATLCNGTVLVRERQGAAIRFKVVGEPAEVREIVHELDRGVVGLLHEPELTGASAS